jgi:succinyl-diaminopimelate desuccinylase
MKNLLKKLIQAAPTAENGELAAAEVLAGYLAENGIEAEIDTWLDKRANVSAHIKSSGSVGGLLFGCHLDVVPPGDQEWKSPPFEAVEKDGKIYGRGSADMKGGTVAITCAITELVNEGIELKGDIILAATAGEETDSTGTKRFVEKNAASIGALRGIILPEPTDFEIVAAHKGVLWLQVTTNGRTAHGSMPHLGVNALLKMNALITRLTERPISCQPDPLLGEFSMSINQILAGKAINVIPDRCSIQIDCRTTPAVTNQDVLDEFNAILAELSAADADFDGKVEINRQMGSMVTDTDCEFVKSFCDVTGIGETIAVGFTTDGPSFVKLGAPVIVFGPGKSDVCHKPDESIDITDLERGKQIYKKIIRTMLT